MGDISPLLSLNSPNLKADTSCSANTSCGHVHTTHGRHGLASARECQHTKLQSCAGIYASRNKYKHPHDAHLFDFGINFRRHAALRGLKAKTSGFLSAPQGKSKPSDPNWGDSIFSPRQVGCPTPPLFCLSPARVLCLIVHLPITLPKVAFRCSTRLAAL